MADNPFDEFDVHEPAQSPASNPFDQFDAPPTPTLTTAPDTAVARPPAKAPASSSANPFDQFDTPSATVDRGPSGDFTPIGDAPPDFGTGKVTPGEMDSAGKEFRRLGTIAGQSAASRTLNLGAVAQQINNPGEMIAARLTGIPDEATQTGQMRQMAKSIAPNVAPDDRGGRLAEMVGGLAPDLVAATATGGLAELPAGASLGARALQGAATMALPAAENAREAYERGIANGLTPAQAAAQAAVAGGGTLAMGAVPANVPGDLATRAVSGSAIAALQTEGQRRLSNALLPEDRQDLQQPFDAFDLGAGALTGGVLAGLLGHGGQADSARAEASAPTHVPETIRPGQTTQFVADDEGILREVPKAAQGAPDSKFGSAPNGPRDSKANAAEFESSPPASNPFDQFHEPVGLLNPFDAFDPPESAPAPAPSGSERPSTPRLPGVPDLAQPPPTPRFPDAEPGSMAHAAKAIPDSAPAGNRGNDTGGTPPSDNGDQVVQTSVGPRRLNDSDYDVGYGGSSQKDGTIVLQRGFDYTIPDGPLKGLDTRPFLAEHEAVERDLENRGLSYTDAHRQATDAEHTRLLDALGLEPDTPQADHAIDAYEAHNARLLDYSTGIQNSKDAPNLVELPYEHPHNEEQRRLLGETEQAGNVPDVRADQNAAGVDVGEVSSGALTQAERDAFDRQRSTVVNDYTMDNAPPELRDLMAREEFRSAAREVQRQDSVQGGEADAGRLGLRSAVDAALGDSGIKVNFVRDESGLPDSVKLSNLPDGAQRSGLFDPDTKQAYVFTKVARTPEQAAFTAAHEIAGHNGLRALAASRPDVLIGGRTPEKALNDALDQALKNTTVAKIADSMASQRGSSDRYRMAEEALADLAGATRTGDWARIKDRHGVDVSDTMRGAARSALANFIDRVKQIVGKIFGHETFTDAQVHALIEDAWQASKDSAASTGRSNTALDSAHAGGRDSEDFLHEAHSIAKRGAFAKMFQFAKDGDRTVVSYKDKEVTRIDGPVDRKSLSVAIAAKIGAARPEQAAGISPDPAKTAGGDISGNSALPPRRPGETPGAYARRVSTENADDLRAATALKSQQKTIGRHAIREMLATRSRAMDVADAAFNEYRKLFDKTDPAKNLEHVDEWETGKRVTDPDMRAFLAQMRAGFNERVQRLRELDPRALQHLITHYMPHIYSDPAKAARLLKANVDAQAARHSIAGGKEFLEPRSWPTLKWAMHSGLEPITNNPVDWIMLRYASMDKLIGSLELKHELDNRGWLSKVSSDEEPPLGYKRVADPAFSGYAVPEPIARDITNYLDPGFSKYAAWRTLRGAQNFLVAADLGFSGFHAVFTGTDGVIMHVDSALRRAAIGDSRGAALTLLKALPSLLWSPLEGRKLNQQWRGIREADANTTAILDALERGGARWKMSSTEHSNALPKIARMFRQMSGAGIGAQLRGKTPTQIAVGAVKMPLTALQAAAEAGSYLIHHWLVPNQKMAARVLLYKYELDRRAQDLWQQRGNYAGIIEAMHPDVVRQLAAQVNDVVDYRLGQMTYDNRFWPRVVQDVAQAAVMAPGWQYGMLQTVLGAGKAAKDLVSPTKLVAPLDRAGTITNAHMGRVSSNLSYFLTLAVTLGGGMAALQYMLTGQGPTQLKDLFFPKTGRKNDDDSDERLQLPNYWVDHYKLATEPGQTAENKIHPLWKMLWEVGHNKDYFGTRIRDPNAPALEQAQEVGKYLASKFVPITFGNMQKGAQRNETTARQAGHFFGINAAPARVARSDFQNFVTQGGTRGWGDYVKTPEDAQRRQQMHAASAAIRRGEQPDFANLAPADQIKARKDAKLPVPVMLFKSLSDTDKLHAYEMATPDERQQYRLHGVISRMNIEKSAPFKRLAPADQAKVRQRLQSIRSGEQ